ncbi:sporulation protein [Halarchaeum sp. P4]|uniref:sporulation protein n=1 Tax=Halarchaeum sp. P4 TaxID=3421639 RepID=UPI003EB8EE1C
MSELLSRIGIGAATVDTRLPSTVTAGETVTATVDVAGGDAEQTVERIYFAIRTRYESEDTSGVATVARETLAENFTIDPGEERSFEVDLDVPRETPVTVGHTEVWVDTGLDVEWAIDPEDRDHLDVQPSERQRTVLDAIEDLGFSLKTAYPESAPGGLFDSARFMQEFEYLPRSGPYRGDLDELEVVFHPTADALDVRLQVDTRGGVLTELADTDLDERLEQVRVTEDDDVDSVRADIEDAIERNL